VRIDTGTLIDLLPAPRHGDNLDHFCLVLSAGDWDEAVRTPGIEVLRGPSRLFGAKGYGTSVYTRDPDGNTIELRHYGE
jgi:catechol 2,3-dioxygenase-like lactoylglutathione lyase family enzyme